MAESKRFGADHPALAGLVMIVLGILLLAMPGASLKTVIYLFGIMVIVYGLMRIVAGLRGHMESKSAGVVGGLFAIILGVMILAWPELSALTLVYLIGGWAIVTGVVDIGGAFVSKEGGAHRVWIDHRRPRVRGVRSDPLLQSGRRRTGSSLAHRDLPARGRLPPHHRGYLRPDGQGPRERTQSQGPHPF